MNKIVVAAALLLPALAVAQAPTKVGYQGRILKSDGTPEAGVLTLSFGLYTGASGGAALWTEEQSVGLADGFYGVFLGDVKPFPPQAFDGTEKFLEVSVGGQALTPRQRITSVPYAMVAGSVVGGAVDAASISVGGKPVIDSSGKLAGSALTAPQGSGLSSGDSGLTLTTACSAGQILKWNGTAWECAADGGNTYTAGSGLALNAGAFSLITNCASGQILKWTGSAWECAADGGNTYTAGTGLGLKDGAFSLLPGCALGQVPQWDGSAWVCADVASTPSLQSVAISNLLKNGDLEQWNAGNSMPVYWQDFGKAANRAVAKVGGYFNASGVKVTDGDMSDTAALQQVVYASAPPSLAGQVVTLSVWSKWSAGVAAGKVCIADAGADEAETSITCQKLNSAASSSAWAKTVVSHTVSSSPAYLKVVLNPTTTAPETGAYQFDGAMLVLGTFQGNFSANITEQLYDGGIPSSKLAGVEVSAPLAGKGIASSPLSLPAATTTQDGYLKATDFATFANAKVNAVTAVAPLASSGGTNPEIKINNCPNGQVLRFNGSAWACSANVTAVTAAAPLSATPGETPELSLPKASGSQDGYLSKENWTTFNNKVTSISAGANATITGTATEPVINFAGLNYALTTIHGNGYGWFTQGNAWSELTAFKTTFTKKSAGTRLRITLVESVDTNSGGYWCVLGVAMNGGILTNPNCTWSYYGGSRIITNTTNVCYVSGVSAAQHTFTVHHKSQYCYYGNYAWDYNQQSLMIEELP